MGSAESRRILACRHIRGEMYEQPQVLARLARHVEHFAGQVGVLAAEQGGFRDVVVLASAPSQPIALLGRHAAALRQGVQAKGLDRRLVIAICASGDDDRVLELTHRGLNSGSSVVAVTNDARSALARAATLSVDVAAGLELSNSATKSVTGMMLAVLALVDGLPELRVGSDGNVESAGKAEGPRIADSASAGALAEAVGALLADREPADAAAARLVNARRVAVVGQGHHHPAALETARMLRETAGLMVEGFSVEGFCSGPMGGFDANTAVVLLAGRGHTAVRSLGARLRARGARVIVLGDDPNQPDDLLFPSVGALGTVSASAECILATVRGQQLGLAALRALGVDPDRPAGQALAAHSAQLSSGAR
jgi:glutamine---fructose-6-phosphate transaminase (isomerizing)